PLEPDIHLYRTRRNKIRSDQAAKAVQQLAKKEWIRRRSRSRYCCLILLLQIGNSIANIAHRVVANLAPNIQAVYRRMVRAIGKDHPACSTRIGGLSVEQSLLQPDHAIKQDVIEHRV